MCATIIGRPSSINAGPASMTRTMYEAVTGRPMPRTSEASPISMMARKGLPADSDTTKLENFSPSPVRLTHPTMIPAHPQATETITAFFAPASRAEKMSLMLRRVALRSMDAATVDTTAMKPAIIGL